MVKVDKVQELSKFEAKVKKQNKRITINNIIRYFVVLFLLLASVFYLFGPVSSLKNTKLIGYHLLNYQEVLNIMNVNENDHLYLLDEEKSEELLNNHPLIKDADIKINLFNLEIDFNEALISVIYGEDIYSSFGSAYSVIEDQNLIKDYISLHKNKAAFATSSPLEYSSKYKDLILNTISLINLEEKLCYFVDFDLNEESFTFYFKVDSNLSYLRVKLTYDDKFTFEDYANRFTKENLLKMYNEYISILESKNITILGNEITYIGIRAYINDKNQLSATGE